MTAMMPHATANHKPAAISTPPFDHDKVIKPDMSREGGNGHRHRYPLPSSCAYRVPQNFPLPLMACSTGRGWLNPTTRNKKADMQSAPVHSLSAAKALSRISSTGPTPAILRYFGAPG